MANKVLLELEAVEKIVVADLRIALLVAQNKVTGIERGAETEFKVLQQRTQALHAAATAEVEAAAVAFRTKLKSLAVAAKIDSADLQFDAEKYFFYLKTEATEKVEDAVKAVDGVINAEIKKGEAAAVSEVKAVEQKVLDVAAEIKKAL